MFVEVAAWLRDTIAGLDLGERPRVLDIGSSTQHYRTVDQPHVEREVMAPLRERGAEITHVDAKDAEGVDVALDLDLATPEELGALGQAPLVLVIGLIGYVREPEKLARTTSRFVAPGGWLITSTPESYRRTLDPRDNGWRPTPDELASTFERQDGDLRRVETTSIRIDDSRYYRGLHSRPSWVPLGRRWIPLPPPSERLRHRVKGWRWRESCAVLRRPAER
jgi:SAM-dependent methyltransferase